MRINIRYFCLAAWILLSSCGNRIEDQPEEPNLLFVFADQYRKQAVGFMNEDPVITPNLDQLAQEGMAFTNAVSCCPICSPYRAMLMTGRFPMSTGMTSNCMPGTDLEMDENELCIGDILKENGYTTGYIGKWHLEVPSLNRSGSPVDGATDPWDGWTPQGPEGMDLISGMRTIAMGNILIPNYWEETPERIDVDMWSVEHETEVALEFIRNRPAQKPFALFMSWNPPHTPYIAPEVYKKRYEGKELPERPNVVPDQKYRKRYRAYLAAVTSCDDQFGRIMEYLEENGLTENTIVVFTSDHGEMMGSHGRYAKSIWYDESIGIPFIIRWGEHIKPSVESMPFACYNFTPTLLGLMGIGIPGSVEGTDYSDFILGYSRERASSAVIASYGNPAHLLAEGQKPSVWALIADSLHQSGIDWRTVGYRGLRTERYTYVVDRGKESKSLKRYLYDNLEDPYQLQPVKAVHASENKMMQELDGELQLWLDKMHDPFPMN